MEARRAATGVAVLGALLTVATPGAARGDRTFGAIVETTGGFGWRTSLGQDPSAAGFNALTGGADLLVGLDIAGAVGVVTGGRLRGGSSGGARYLEVAGDLGAQLHVGERVRARAGIDAGRAWIENGGSSVLIGGWLALAIDLLPLASGRVAAALAVRLDVGAFPGRGEGFPAGTLALSVGLGWRY